jgi:hypothetical protein
MNNKEELYESLIRLGLMLIFMFSLTAGTFGLVSICQMLMRNQVARPESSFYTLADAQR